jgi:hypothetical protein
VKWVESVAKLMGDWRVEALLLRAMIPKKLGDMKREMAQFLQDE